MVLGYWTDIFRKMKLDHLLIPHTRINSKWLKNFYVRHKIIKILKENIGSKILDIVHNNFFISPSKGNNNNTKPMGLHQTKVFLHNKVNHRENKKTTHRMGEHINQYG